MKTHLIAPMPGETVALDTDLQRRFWAVNGEAEFLAMEEEMFPEGPESYENSMPLPVVFRWETDAAESVLEIARDPEFQQIVRTYTLSAAEAEVYNLEVSSRYFWRVNGSEPSYFYVDASLPRVIRIPGLENIRDCGGWKNNEGRTYKQGMFLRGVRFENISEEGIQAFREIGLKTDLDLRAEAIGKLTKSPLGDDFKFILQPCAGYDEFWVEDGEMATKKLFDVLCDESNYPLYFHCAGGQDRTGTLAIAVGAILGIDQEILFKDYEYSQVAYPNPDMRRSRYGELLQQLLTYLDQPEFGEGDYCAKTLRALRKFGVTDEMMDKIRSILLED